MSISNGLKNSLNKIREISSEIYHQYIPVLEDDTDISQLATPVLTVPEVYNEFCSALINRIVYTQVNVKMFNNPLKALEGETMPLGYAGQEIYINPAQARQYNVEDFAGILAKYESDVKVQYLTKNLDVQYPVTIVRTKLKEAFVSWEALDRFINAITQSLYNGMYIDEYAMTKSLVSSAYKANNVQVEVVSNPRSSEANAKAFVEKARQLFLDFQAPSSKYNAWSKIGGSGKAITTWTNPEDIVVLIRNDVRSYLDVNVLADAFNIDKSTLLGNMYTVDSFDVVNRETGHKVFDGSNIYGIIADRSWFKIKPIDEFMEDFRNASNRSISMFLNKIAMYEYSLFANAVVLASSEAPITITALDFGADSITISVDDQEGLEVLTTPRNANTPAIEFTTNDSDGSVITIAPSDLIPNSVIVTAIGQGSKTITATAGNVSKTITVNVE